MLILFTFSFDWNQASHERIISDMIIKRHSYLTAALDSGGTTKEYGAMVFEIVELADIWMKFTP
jgi:hypothetical protein